MLLTSILKGGSSLSGRRGRRPWPARRRRAPPQTVRGYQVQSEWELRLRRHTPPEDDA